MIAASSMWAGWEPTWAPLLRVMTIVPCCFQSVPVERWLCRRSRGDWWGLAVPGLRCRSPCQWNPIHHLRRWFFRKNHKLIKATTTQHHNSRTTNLHNQTRKLRVRGLDMAFAQIVLNLAVRLAQPRITESLHPLVRRLSVSPWN